VCRDDTCLYIIDHILTAHLAHAVQYASVGFKTVCLACDYRKMWEVVSVHSLNKLHGIIGMAANMMTKAYIIG
jgi:hypothetical protein